MENNKQSEEKSIFRPPIVTVMGHVDHGKTSILDAIRNTHVTDGEYGGITQHIGAYQITYKKQKITFIDTPGHEAFTQMRARGGKAADIVILVVAADSGVQPQTKEAIAHAKSAGVHIIVAINKVDLPGADPQRVKQQLAVENILVEDWGGDIVSIEVSAKTRLNIDNLLDAVLAVSDIMELKNMPDSELEAVIIEAKKDSKRGVLATAIVKSGTLKLGQDLVAGNATAKVKALTDDKGKNLLEALPSTPVEISGFREVPNVGDIIVLKGSELASLAVDTSREEIIGKDTKRVVSIVIRADTQGTLEAVKASLANLVTSGAGLTFSLKFLLSTTGDIATSDIMLAQNGDGIVIGFNVKISQFVKDLAQDLNVVVKSYKTIYELIDDAEDLLEGTARSEEKKVKGRAQILKIFKLPSLDVILGSKVDLGSLKVGNRVAFYDKNPADIAKNDEPLFITYIKKLKIGKDDVEIVGRKNECGILFKPQYEDAQKGMWIEVL